jgi:hypothetical protein
MENHLRYFIGAKAEMKVLSHESESLTGEFRRTVNARKRRLTEIVMGILREIRPEGGVDLRVATFSLFGMMNWLYNWHQPEVDPPVERLVDDMYRIFVYGYLPAGAQVPEGAGDSAGGETRPIWRTAAA